MEVNVDVSQQLTSPYSSAIHKILFYCLQSLLCFLISFFAPTHGQGLTCETPKDCEVGELFWLIIMVIIMSEQMSTTRTAASGAIAPGPHSLGTRARPKARVLWRTGREVRPGSGLGDM